MAKYTGILGTRKSQLGIFALGGGLVTGDNSQSVTDSVTVTSQVLFGTENNQSVSDSVTVTSTVAHTSDVNRTITSSVTVSQALAHPGDVSKSVTSSVTVSDSIVITGNPHVFLTQAVTEYFYSEDPTARVSQAVVEYFYTPSRDVSITVTDSIAVTSTSRTNEVHVHVSDLALVNHVCFGRNTNIRISVVSSISVTVPSVQKNDITVTDTVTVSDNVERVTNNIYITVTDTVTTPNFFPNPVTFRISPIRIGVADHIIISDSVAGGTAIRNEAVAHAVSVHETIRDSPVQVAIKDAVTVTDALTDTLGVRPISVIDTVGITERIQGRDNNNRQSIRNVVRVSHVLTPDVQVKNPLITVIDSIVVSTTAIANGRITVVDQVTVNQIVTPFNNARHQFVVDTVTVLQNIRFTPVSLTVSDSITAKPAFQISEFFVLDNVTVTDSVHRDYFESLSDTLTFTETPITKMERGRSVMDTLPIIQVLDRNLIWNRSLSDTIIIPDTLYKRVLDFAGTTINVPVAIGTLVSKTTTLKSKKGIIILPAPLLGDSLDNVAKTTIQRSMNATTLVFKQSSTRQKLKNTFRLDGIKAFELRKFLEDNLSELITLTTWNAQIWSVYITSDPFELQNAGRSFPAGIGGGPNEFSTIELEFEGVKLSG